MVIESRVLWCPQQSIVSPVNESIESRVGELAGSALGSLRAGVPDIGFSLSDAAFVWDGIGSAVGALAHDFLLCLRALHGFLSLLERDAFRAAARRGIFLISA